MKFFWIVRFAVLGIVFMFGMRVTAQPLFTVQSAPTQPTNQKINWKQDLNLEHWLLKHDLTTLANHIAAEPPTSDTPAQFLFRLRVYAQAGHFSRIEKAIQVVQKNRHHTSCLPGLGFPFFLFSVLRAGTLLH